MNSDTRQTSIIVLRKMDEKLADLAKNSDQRWVRVLAGEILSDSHWLKAKLEGDLDTPNPRKTRNSVEL